MEKQIEIQCDVTSDLMVLYSLGKASAETSDVVTQTRRSRIDQFAGLCVLGLDRDRGRVVADLDLYVQLAEERRIEPDSGGVLLLIDHPVDALTQAVAPFAGIGVTRQTHGFEGRRQRVGRVDDRDTSVS